MRKILILCLLLTGSIEAQRIRYNIPIYSPTGETLIVLEQYGDQVKTALTFLNESYPNKRFLNVIKFEYYGTMKTPVLPNLNLILFKDAFKGLIDPAPRYPGYYVVAIDTVRKMKKMFMWRFVVNQVDSLCSITIAESLACENTPPYSKLRIGTREKDYDELKRRSFNEFVDTTDVIKINDEKEAESYAKFVITALYQEAVLDDKTNKRILLYLRENLADSLEKYFPKATVTAEGYSVRIYAYTDMYDFHPLDLNVYEYVLKIKRNGFILEAFRDSKMPLPDIKEHYSPLAGKRKLKPLIEAKLSDSLAVRKFPECPLPKFPDWAVKDKIVTSFKIYVKVKSDGTILECPAILKTTGSGWWDNDIIRWIKEKWKWEESPLQTEGTVEINFNWTKK